MGEYGSSISSGGGVCEVADRRAGGGACDALDGARDLRDGARGAAAGRAAVGPLELVGSVFRCERQEKTADLQMTSRETDEECFCWLLAGLGGLRDEVSEEGAGGGAGGSGAFGMPLDGEKTEASGGVGLNSFDDGILRATGGDTEARARDGNGLMMGGVDGKTRMGVGDDSFGGVDEG